MDCPDIIDGYSFNGSAANPPIESVLFKFQITDKES